MIPLTPDTDVMPQWLGRTPEHCCFCAAPTNLWYEPNDVAVCAPCGEVRDPSEVPTKDEWWDSPQAKGLAPPTGLKAFFEGQKRTMTPKAYRAQETRWRFLSVCTKDNVFHRVEMQDRSCAILFAEHLVLTGAARKVSLVDTGGTDSGHGWAAPPDR
jgi:hypothetical protein